MIITLRVAVAAVAGAAMLAASGTVALADPAAPGNALAVKQLTSTRFAVTVSVPRSWTKTPHAGTFAYDGASGWMGLDASTEPGGLKNTCRTVAAGGSLRIYGRHPRIVFRAIDGRPGCIIWPSKDAPSWSHREGGPKFQQAGALVTYRHPLRGYALLDIFADPGHVTSLVNSAELHH